MVKCCIFIIGLVAFISGLIGLIIGIINSLSYGEFRVGVIIGAVAMLFGILFLWLGVKLERDEEEAKRQIAIKKAEEEEIARKEKKRAEMEKTKQLFIQQKMWEKEFEKEEAKPVYCTNCGIKLTPEQLYCEKCGAPKKRSLK